MSRRNSICASSLPPNVARSQSRTIVFPLQCLFIPISISTTLVGTSIGVTLDEWLHHAGSSDFGRAHKWSTVGENLQSILGLLLVRISPSGMATSSFASSVSRTILGGSTWIFSILERSDPTCTRGRTSAQRPSTDRVFGTIHPCPCNAVDGRKSRRKRWKEAACCTIRKSIGCSMVTCRYGGGSV